MSFVGFRGRFCIYAIFLWVFALLFAVGNANAQLGNAGSIEGTVTDQSGGAVPGASVAISNPVTGFQRSAMTGTDGAFRFTNVPFNPYHLVVSEPGFTSSAQDVDVRSTVPVTLQIGLKVGSASTEITVEAKGEDLVEKDPTFHTDVDQAITDRLPIESASSSVSSLVTLVSPGIAADSNGLFHGLGDHAQNSFAVDNQPISDQQSKIFSNQIPSDSIQSLEVISGAPPAEYGDKTSLVIKVTTRSGLGVTRPTGRIYTSYGSFGTTNSGLNLAWGGSKWGEFIAVNGLDTSRFLDPPELTAYHDKGNQENVFDRLDYQFGRNDTIHLNLGYTHSSFQNPNTYDQEFHICAAGFICNANGVAVNPVNGAPLGPTDDRSRIETLNIAPTWTRLMGPNAVFDLSGFVRKDQYNYYPSADPFADFSPSLNAQTIAQSRSLTNAGARADLSYVKGIHNVKVGATYQQWLLTESDNIATVDPGFAGLFNQLDATGAPIPNPAIPGTNFNCSNPLQPNEVGPCQTLSSVDLTAGGSPFSFRGHTDVKELSLYLQDTITKGNFAFNLGLRGDIYNGFVSDRQPEPRLGVAYNIKRTNTVFRLSYARTMETPFNENLIIANEGCSDPVIAVLVPPPNISCASGFIHPGWRNEFHAGLEQAFGKYLVVDGEYIWKYTHNGYDFGVVAATPIAFPLSWTKSKIPGWLLRVSVPTVHGFTALVVMSSVAARFFPPQVGGVPFLPAPGVFRIDHDERFNQTSHLQYQPWKTGPWLGFNWRYDNGLVAGAVPCVAPTATCSFTSSPFDYPGVALGAIPGTTTPLPTGQVAFINNLTGLPLTADQEFQAGFTCDGKLAAPTPFGPALPTCDAAGLGSIYIKIPPPGTENDDHHPQRIAPRNLFDASIGQDNLFKGDRYKWSLRLTVINLTNKKALYNFFSTFSGTHYVTPRTETVELGFHF